MIDENKAFIEALDSIYQRSGTDEDPNKVKGVYSLEGFTVDGLISIQYEKPALLLSDIRVPGPIADEMEQYARFLCGINRQEFDKTKDLLVDVEIKLDQSNTTFGEYTITPSVDRFPLKFFDGLKEGETRRFIIPTEIRNGTNSVAVIGYVVIGYNLRALQKPVHNLEMTFEDAIDECVFKRRNKS